MRISNPDRDHMANKFICGGEKYEVGPPKEDTIILPVSLAGLPAEIEVKGYKLVPRTSFHVSLVCIGKIIEKHNVSIPDFINKVTNDFCNFVQIDSIDFLRYRDEFRFAALGEKRSVVVMCDVSNLDKFFTLINKKYGLKLEYPPTHVTLYTLPEQRGIFLADSEDIKKLTKPIPNPGLVLR